MSQHCGIIFRLINFDPQIESIIRQVLYRRCPVACPGIRKGGGGGESLKGFFFAFQYFKGGPSSENSRSNYISD